MPTKRTSRRVLHVAEEHWPQVVVIVRDPPPLSTPSLKPVASSLSTLFNKVKWSAFYAACSALGVISPLYDGHARFVVISSAVIIAVALCHIGLRTLLHFWPAYSAVVHSTRDEKTAAGGAPCQASPLPPGWCEAVKVTPAAARRRPPQSPMKGRKR